MELSVRCYYVSVSYDKFIKRRFHSLRITREDFLQDFQKHMHYFRIRFIPVWKICEYQREIFDKRFSTAHIYREKSSIRESAQRENVGLVRFELTIDGSLRHASVLQRIIINHQNFNELSMSSLTQVRKVNSADPLFIICEHKERKDRWSPSPFRARPQPLGHAGTYICP